MAEEWKPIATAVADKWEGEDEEENIKDNWDDEDEEEPKQPETPTHSKPVESAKKKNKKFLEKLAERERKELEELEPEIIARNKLLEEKHREESELLLAKETFGVQSANVSDPHTKDDFDELRKNLVDDLSKYEKRPVYEDFLEDLVQDFCLNLPPKRLKKIKTMVEALYFEKSKTEKDKLKVQNKKGASKAKLNVEGDRAILSSNIGEEYDDFDDFM